MESKAMKEEDYRKRILELEQENRMLREKLDLSESNRALGCEILETHSKALKVRNEELEKSRDLLRKSEAKYRELAHHDALTGLPNRAYFQEQLSLAVETARYFDSGLALLFIDLDRFKLINDNYGHITGDIFLIKIARQIKRCIREEDIIARIGGDEFTILLRVGVNLASIVKICERIMQTTKKPIVLAGSSHQLGLSIGVSLFPTDDKTPEGLLKKADQAMYSVKKEETGGYRFYGNTNEESMLKHDALNFNMPRSFKTFGRDITKTNENKER